MTADFASIAPQVIVDLRDAGIQIDDGLDDLELSSLEAALELLFPPDLRALLQAGVPVGDRFPDWRGPLGPLEERVGAPIEGLLFDVEQNGLWLDDWGLKPGEADAALATARENLKQAPPLVPVWGHRYLPTAPHEEANPVLSVMQSDIVAYGNDLSSYLSRELGIPTRSTPPLTPKPTPFWSQFVD